MWSHNTGKSVAALWRLHMACLRKPRTKCLIVRKTGVSLTSTTLVTFEEKVATEALQTGIVTWFGGSSREPASYRYSNKSRIVVGGMDKPDKVMSSEYDLIFADEATELDITDWEKLGTRLRNGKLPWQQQIAACNPGPPHHWMNQRANEGRMRRLVSRHRDNPRYVNADGSLTDEGTAYLGRLDNLTGVRKLRLRDGIWAAAEGLIYEGWDESIHLIDPFEIPESWPRYWTIDFGFTNPFVCQWWAEDPDGRLVMYREIYMTGRTVDEHAATIASIVLRNPTKKEGESWKGEWMEPKPVTIICDHDAEGRATLKKELGLGTTAAFKKVSEGIQAVQKRLRPAGDGRPRVQFMRDVLVERDRSLAEAGRPVCTVEEIVGYIWKIKPGEKVTEEPVKEDDHGMDDLRYTVAFRDIRTRPRLDWM
jgi:phage terminase large subunit